MQVNPFTLPSGEYALASTDQFEPIAAIEMNYTKDRLVIWHNGYFNELELPPGSWSLIGQSSTVPEEVAKTVVESETIDALKRGGGRMQYDSFKDYENDGIFLEDARQSLLSLVKSKGHVPTDVLIKKIK